MGPPRGVPISTKSDTNRETVGPRSMLEGIVRKLPHKRCLGTPSNHENNGFVLMKRSFSLFHLEVQNNREWCPMGTLWDTFGWFLELWGDILGDNKSIEHLIEKMSQVRIRPRDIWGPKSLTNLLPFSDLG